MSGDPKVEPKRADSRFPCPVFDPVQGRPCGEPCEEGTLTCRDHRARPTRTEISRQDAARKRYGV